MIFFCTTKSLEVQFTIVPFQAQKIDIKYIVPVAIDYCNTSTYIIHLPGTIEKMSE